MHRIFVPFILAIVAVDLSVPVGAEPVTLARVSALATNEQAAWKAYLARSETNALADQAALQAEVAAKGMSNALRAPGGGDFKLPAEPGDGWYGSDTAKHVATVLLSYQTPSGGWSKHTGYGKGGRQKGMQFSSQSEPGQRPHYLGTFDNRATTEEMCFLAAVWQATKREDCRTGFLKGLDYILAAQYPNGGWPQVYPLEGDYHDDITFNDDAMTRVLTLLHGVVNGDPAYGFVDEAHRQRAAAALKAGIQCVLKTQVIQAGKRTAWCAQYDALTLQPAPARKMEPATLSGLESAHILKFLMTITNPPPEMIRSIEAGLEWFEQVKVTSLTKSTVDGKTAYVTDTNSSRIYWARFYDLTSSRPVFPGRDGVVYSSFAEMSANNKLGYDYYTTLPGSIVGNGQKKWRKLLTASAKK